jgi:hypothetical protein
MARTQKRTCKESIHAHAHTITSTRDTPLPQAKAVHVAVPEAPLPLAAVLPEALAVTVSLAIDPLARVRKRAVGTEEAAAAMRQLAGSELRHNMRSKGYAQHIATHLH